MNAKSTRPAGPGRSTKRVLLDIVLIVTIPTLVIYAVSLIWH